MTSSLPIIALAGVLSAADGHYVPHSDPNVQYAQWSASPLGQYASVHHPPIGPGRSCDSASLSDPHVRLICTNDRLAEDWLAMNQAGYALRYQMGDTAYLPLMRAEGAAAWTELRASCPIPPLSTSDDVVSCIEGHIVRERARIMSRLSQMAAEEAKRDIHEHIRLQEALIELHYLQGPADGMLGPASREAISRFQRDNNIVASGFMTSETAQALPRAVGVRAYQAPPSSAQPAPAVAREETKPQPAATGSAFFITSDGYLLTNSHVVKDCTAITVSYGKEGSRAARVIARDETNDLAIMSSGLMPTAVATFRSGVRLGEPVAVYGFPLSGLLASGGNFTLGNVTALAGIHGDSRILQISAPVQPGNSGGPLLDESGAVVGIVVAKLNAIKLAMATADLAQNINFAIKASAAQAFAEAQGLSIRTAPPNGAPLRPADLADRAKSFTGFVECLR